MITIPDKMIQIIFVKKIKEHYIDRNFNLWFPTQICNVYNFSVLKIIIFSRKEKNLFY